ncbi:MAG: glucosaminidase domain-containing protein [Acetobacterales bacterium]
MLTKLGPISAATAFALFAAGCSEFGPASAGGSGNVDKQLSELPAGTRVEPAPAARLQAKFRDHGYELDAVRSNGNPVPRLYVVALPPDIADVAEVDARKRLFIRCVLPAVLAVNEAIAADRRFVSGARELLADGGTLAPGDRSRLDRIFDKYDVERGDIATLLRRVDVVPPALALAQAAIESGWGRSRFAQEGRALFGQHAASESDGLAARGVKDGSVRVQSFRSLRQSVASYMRNLNTHAAYDAFRGQRAAMRERGMLPDGHGLAGTLIAYSERRQTYVKELRAIIDANAFASFDQARLADGNPHTADSDDRLAANTRAGQGRAGTQGES